MIELFAHGSPNPHEVAIALEELGLSYKVTALNPYAGEGDASAFRAISPNGKVPAIIDHDTGATVFESNAILMYLAEKAGRLMPTDATSRWKAIQWLFFQAACVVRRTLLWSARMVLAVLAGEARLRGQALRRRGSPVEWRDRHPFEGSRVLSRDLFHRRHCALRLGPLRRCPGLRPRGVPGLCSVVRARCRPSCSAARRADPRAAAGLHALHRGPRRLAEARSASSDE